MPPQLATFFSALLLLTTTPLTASAESLYPKSSKVLNVDSKSYERLITKSNYTSIVEFYAPWCGHCKNLKPQYEKAATSLAGLANVAAINCDDADNKPFCGSMGIQGFPTLKLVKPPKKKGGKPIVEDYNGPRTAKGIKESVLEKIPNHVTRVKDDNLEKFLKSSQPKAMFFSEKGLISPLAKALAIDFLGALEIGYARDGDKKVVDKFGVTSFPAVVLIPTDGEPIKYDGEIKKADLVDFLSKAASPNPDAGVCPVGKGKKDSTSSKSKPSKKAAETVVDEAKDPKASPSPDPKVETDPEATPIEVPLQSPPSASPKPRPQYLSTADALHKACLHSRSATCVLALLPGTVGAESDAPVVDSDGADNSSPGQGASEELLEALGDIARKYKRGGTKMFPFYSLSGTLEAGSGLVDALKLDKKILESSPVVVAVNGKKGWYIHYGGDTGSQAGLEDWVDAIRLGDVKKEKLPDGLIKEAEEQTVKEGKKEAGKQAAEDALKVEWMEEISDEEAERLMARGREQGRDKDEL